MPTQVFYIAGVPASGKSAIFRELRTRLFGDATTFQHKTLRGIVSSCGHFIMLGVFDGSITEGTDKLSYSVIDDAIDYVKKQDAKGQKSVIFAEGDRLFNHRFLATVSASLLLIDADEEVLQQRHIMRGDSQTVAFLKRCRTKVENFAKRFGIRMMPNNTKNDQRKIVEFLIKKAQQSIL